MGRVEGPPETSVTGWVRARARRNASIGKRVPSGISENLTPNAATPKNLHMPDMDSSAITWSYSSGDDVRWRSAATTACNNASRKNAAVGERSLMLAARACTPHGSHNCAATTAAHGGSPKSPNS